MSTQKLSKLLQESITVRAEFHRNKRTRPQVKAVLDRLNKRFHVPETFIMDSKLYPAAFEKAYILATSNLPVLIHGETGTGKETLARFIHANSDRAGKPFTVVDCGALSETVAESELFGHSAGSFTGATSDRIGLIKSADSGTVFLDEIDKLPPAIQKKLLRVLEAGEVRPVGSDIPQKVKVRFLFASSGNLKNRIAAEDFLRDLYFRISKATVTLPALRTIMNHEPKFLFYVAFEHITTTNEGRRWIERFGVLELYNKTRSLKSWLKYPWPGNVREFLDGYIKQAIITGDWSTPDNADLLPDDAPQPPKTETLDVSDEPDEKTLIDRYDNFLQGKGYAPGKIAKVLGVSTSTRTRRKKRQGSK